MALRDKILTAKSFLKLAAFLALIITTQSSASATDFKPEGGPGGAPFRDECPAGQFLIGTKARTGSVVDMISITCGTVTANGQITNVTQDRDQRGGTGGNVPRDSFDGKPRKTNCESNEIINAMAVLPGRSPDNGPTVVRLIIFNCKLIDGTARHNLDIGDAPLFPDILQTCPAGEIATGIQGRSGKYVDAVGLICGPFNRNSPGTGPAASGCAGLSGDEKAICDQHNVLRAKHASPALTWSKELAANAKAWVAGCHTQKDALGNEFFCHQNKGFGCGTDANYHYGENLSWFWGTPQLTPAEVVNGWYCENNVYDYDNPKIGTGVMFGCNNNPGKVTGHFTQVVWKSSKLIGCAKNTCPLGGNSATLWACEYDPAGNDTSKLSENVLRPMQTMSLPGAAPLRFPPAQKTTAIISDVDLYDVPGGVGKVIGIMRRGQQYPLLQCKDDNWCQLSEGWVWGSFIVRNHTRPYSEMRIKP